MTGAFAFTIKEFEEAGTKWLTSVQGDDQAVKSEIEAQTDITCPELKQAAEALKGEGRDRRAELHFRIASHRDARYSVAGSQYVLRMALWNRLRAQYESARAAAPYELGREG